MLYAYSIVLPLRENGYVCFCVKHRKALSIWWWHTVGSAGSQPLANHQSVFRDSNHLNISQKLEGIRFYDIGQQIILGYYRNLGSLRYGNEYCVGDAVWEKIFFFLFNWSLFNNAVKLHVHWFMQCYIIVILLVALLSSVACELAPLRIVLLCWGFFNLFLLFLHV